MAFNGSGTFSATNVPVTTGTTISSSAYNATITDIATGLTNTITRDGQSPATANIPLGSNKITGLASGSNLTDAANLGQVQNQLPNWGGTAGGTANALTISPTPAITAYAAGQVFRFKAGASPNSAATTLAISGLATIAVQVNGAACVGGEIAANQFYEVILDSVSTCQLLQIGRPYLADLATTATTATTANRTDSGEVTVTANATTGDIFAAAANSILWDDAGGAITCTIFPNASKAGMVRELRCNGSTKFTAGTNLLIEGIPSGTTITLASGALVKVRAITTTQFKMTYSLSGTFTASLTGFSGANTSSAKYKVENGYATIFIPVVAPNTSNATTFTITGLPSSLVPVSTHNLSLVQGLDSGTGTTVSPYIGAGTSIITLDKGVTSGGAWTNSGNKQLGSSEFAYRLD